jgi:HEAT repeat protein
MLAVGPAPEAMADEDLLYYLHDPDAKVRQLCEIALRGRGLRDNHLKLGKLMTDHRPEVRLEVLDYLRHDNDLEPGIWLRRLSHDSSPAVRAAAVRAAAEQPLIDLRDRLEQMVQNDPSPTVQQVAKYYLSCLKLRTSSAGKPQSTKSFTKD